MLEESLQIATLCDMCIIAHIVLYRIWRTVMGISQNKDSAKAEYDARSQTKLLPRFRHLQKIILFIICKSELRITQPIVRSPCPPIRVRN